MDSPTTTYGATREIDNGTQLDAAQSSRAESAGPDRLIAAIKSEYVRIFTERRDDLIAVGFNAALVTICWFLLPNSIVNWLFTLHGPLAFPYCHGDVDAG